jgi:hypothetical protein
VKDLSWTNVIHVAFWLFLFCFFIPTFARAESQVVSVTYSTDTDSICFIAPYLETIIFEYESQDPEFTTFREIFCPIQSENKNWEVLVLIEKIGDSIRISDEDGFQFYNLDAGPAFRELEAILNELISLDNYLKGDNL